MSMSDSLHSPASASRIERVYEIVEHASHSASYQAPLEFFVHHNTLHAFEHLPFPEALRAARKLWHVEPLWPCYRYWQEWKHGRISTDDLFAILDQHFSEQPLEGPLGWPSPREMARALFTQNIEALPDAVVAFHLDDDQDGQSRWSLMEDAPRPTRNLLNDIAALLAQERASGLSPKPTAPDPRHDLFLLTGTDSQEIIDPVFIPWIAAFLDRGQAAWAMPDKEQGLWTAFCRIKGAGQSVRHFWLKDLGPRVRAWVERRTPAATAVIEILEELHVLEADWPAFLESMILELRGWAGMYFWECRAKKVAGSEACREAMVEYVAVRLILHRLAWEQLARERGFEGAAHELTPWIHEQRPRVRPGQGLGHCWQVAQMCNEFSRSDPQWIDAASQWLLSIDTERRAWLWQLAFERGYRNPLLSALTVHAQGLAQVSRKKTPTFQVMFCLDEREESIRRHLEEVDPSIDTFGVAGFFGLAIAFQGLDDPDTFPLCPIIVTPHHRIVEEFVDPERTLVRRRTQRKATLSRWNHFFDWANRSLGLGGILAVIAGAATAPPLLLNLFLPRRMAQWRLWLRTHWIPEPKTRLSLPRAGSAHVDSQTMALGFTTEEKAERVASLLENIGLTTDFAPVVAVFGHDSSSANNPHFAAYSCGACGGRSGAPNARLFARMANRPEVRERLRDRGIVIPEATVFVAGVHDTCRDRIQLLDTDDLPRSVDAALEQLQARLAQACRRNAAERCRRLESAPKQAVEHHSIEHVEERSYDLGQPRPELGHVTNAACIVGRRQLSRGLFLDRRAFLVSYDPSCDPAGTALERILLAIGPVCAGINLEYFFSTVDQAGLGAGTKLPHNVTGMIGVMDGPSSDLRTGLPKQMIEIHEPLRLQLIIEATTATLEAIWARQQALRDLFGLGWVVGITADPVTHALSVFEPGRGFTPWTGPITHLPAAPSSAARHGDRDGFVAPAQIRAQPIPPELHHGS